MKKVLSCLFALCTAAALTTGFISVSAEEADLSEDSTSEPVQETENKENSSDPSSENENSVQEDSLPEPGEPDTPEDADQTGEVPFSTENDETVNDPEENEEKEESLAMQSEALDSPEPLTFTVQPQPQTVNYPDPVTFHVEVSDPDRVASWQWYVTDMAEKDHLLDGVTAATDTLKYLATTKYDNGQRFYCQVTDTDGNVISSDKAAVTIANSDEVLSLLYVGEYALSPGDSIDLSETNYGTGVISFDQNGRDFTFDHVAMKNDWVSSGSILTLATNVALFGEAHTGDVSTLTLIGENDLDNYYYSEKTNTSGVPLEYYILGAQENQMTCVIDGPGTLAIHG